MMKFRFVFSFIIWLYLLYLVISTVLDGDLPSYPGYYISAVFGAIIGFLVIWSDKYREKIIATNQRLAIVLLILLVLLLLLSGVIFRWLGNEFLRLIGTGYFFWFFFSLTGFGTYFGFNKWRASKKQSRSGEIEENTS